MKNKILVFEHFEQCYGSYMLFSGLNDIFGAEQIIIFPYKRSYYGLVDDNYLLLDGKKGFTAPCPYMKRRFVEPWSKEKIIEHLDEFFLWVLIAPRAYAINGLREFISLKKSNIPIAFCDHEDSITIRDDIIKEFKPDFIFKRELTAKIDGIYPLPFSSICFDFQEDIKEKTIDVFCCFGFTHEIRRKIRNLLQTDERLKKYNVIANVNDCGDKMFGYKGYLEMLSSAKINIVARGHGMDSVRRFESVTFSGLVLADKLPLITPNDYENQKHIVYYKNDLSDLVEKIVYYLEHEEERKKIGEAGREHTFKYHTSIRRAEYFLSICNIRTN